MLEDEEEDRMVDLLFDDETGGLILDSYGGCGQVVIGMHHCPGCCAHMHMFCSDAVGAEGTVHMCW